MPLFRKRIVTSTVEARRFTGESDSELELWLGEWFESWVPSKRKLIIRNVLGGESVISAGDWLIRDGIGVISSRFDDAFEKEFEPVAD